MHFYELNHSHWKSDGHPRFWYLGFLLRQLSGLHLPGRQPSLPLGRDHRSTSTFGARVVSKPARLSGRRIGRHLLPRTCQLDFGGGSSQHGSPWGGSLSHLVHSGRPAWPTVQVGAATNLPNRGGLPSCQKEHGILPYLQLVHSLPSSSLYGYRPVSFLAFGTFVPSLLSIACHFYRRAIFGSTPCL